MAHAPLSPSTPTTSSYIHDKLDMTLIPVLDPNAQLTVDELRTHVELCHETLKRLCAHEERLHSPFVRRLVRNLGVLRGKSDAGRCVS